MGDITHRDVLAALQAKATPTRAESSMWFFKTGPGQYGEGDRFMGVAVPDQRLIAKKFHALELDEVFALLHSKWHEARLTALIVLVSQFYSSDEPQQKEIYERYLANTAWINNWDLVDTSAHKIVGPWLIDKDRSILSKLARSELLWDRRIAIIATLHFIRNGDPSTTFEITDLLLDDTHDLIHKAVGWMLREVGKYCDPVMLEDYLKPRYTHMPRTMLRYAIERFSPTRRKAYLSGTI